MSKPGRNEPCYCGSGKKYKQCHLKSDQEAERQRRAFQEAIRYVRRDMLKFARDDQFAEAFAVALPLYWNGLYDVDNAEEMSQTEALWFFDWFTYDYRLPDGRFLIDYYVEARYEALSSHQQQILDAWRDVDPMSGYVLTGYDGQMLHLRDFMTGETFAVYEPGGRGQIETGDVVLGRLVPVLEQLEFSTSVAYLPQAEVTDLNDKLTTAKANAAAENPDISHQAFMRGHNYLFIHHALEQAKLNGRPPVARLDPDRPDKKTQKIAQNLKRFRR